jgi:hypothetical protein
MIAIASASAELARPESGEAMDGFGGQRFLISPSPLQTQWNPRAGKVWRAGIAFHEWNTNKRMAVAWLYSWIAWNTGAAQCR